MSPLELVSRTERNGTMVVTTRASITERDGTISVTTRSSVTECGGTIGVTTRACLPVRDGTICVTSRTRITERVTTPASTKRRRESAGGGFKDIGEMEDNPREGRNEQQAEVEDGITQITIADIEIALKTRRMGKLLDLITYS